MKAHTSTPRVHSVIHKDDADAPPTDVTGPDAATTTEEAVAGHSVLELLESHHALIYAFPQRVMGASEEECADFYVYALEQIEKRKILSAEKYVEREGARFETWLGTVLRNLYIDMKRAQREPRIDLSDTLEATAAARPEPAAEEAVPESVALCERALAALKPESRVLFKLLLLNDLFLTDEDWQVLSERSGRPVPELMELVSELEAQVRNRSAKEQQRQEELTRVFWWVEHYRMKLAHLHEAHGHNETEWSPRTAEQIREVRRKLAKRRKQHAELVRSYRAAGIMVKASYDMIARVLNTSRDAVKMEAYRARRAYLEAALGESDAEER